LERSREEENEGDKWYPTMTVTQEREKERKSNFNELRRSTDRVRTRDSKKREGYGKLKKDKC